MLPHSATATFTFTFWIFEKFPTYLTTLDNDEHERNFSFLFKRSKQQQSFPFLLVLATFFENVQKIKKFVLAEDLMQNPSFLKSDAMVAMNGFANEVSWNERMMRTELECNQFSYPPNTYRMHFHTHISDTISRHSISMKGDRLVNGLNVSEPTCSRCDIQTVFINQEVRQSHFLNVLEGRMYIHFKKKKLRK